jgi:glutaredoxin
MALPFVLNYPPSWAIYGEVGNKAVEISVPMDRILSKNSIYSRLIDADKLIKGEPLVCFASLTCPFCTRAATKLHILRKRNPDANCLLVLTGYPNQLERFTKRTQSSNVPCLVLNDSLFASITEGKVPRIFKLNGGKAIREYEYWAMDDQSLK